MYVYVMDDRIKDMLQPGCIIVDLGCGCGNFLADLSDLLKGVLDWMCHAIDWMKWSAARP